MATTTERQTVYAKCIQEGDKFEQVEWRPWINVEPKDREMLPRLILHRWVRDRGGIRHGERLTVTVYTYDDDTPRHRNGKPRECQSTTFTLEK